MLSGLLRVRNQRGKKSSAIADISVVLDEELQTAMRLLGANSIDQLGTKNVGLSPVTVEFRINAYRPLDQLEKSRATDI